MKTRFLGVLVCYVLINTHVGKAQNIYTVAGNGNAGFSGDGGAATSAELYSPATVTFDSAGNYYIADEQNDAIRKVDIHGIITTVAGTGGVQGFSGDGGLATSAEMYWVISVAFDKAGNMYISDRRNERIRKVNKGGIISTYAGTGTAGYNGDGIAASAAELNNPDDIVVYANSLYIADFSNSRIRKIDLGTGIITTVAGNGTGGFSGDGGPATSAQINNPYGVAFDKHGNMFIGDQSNYCVREVANGSGIITTVAGKGGINGFSGDGGPAISALMSGVTGIAVGSTGNIYIADTPNNRVRKVDGKTGTITTIAGNGTGGYNGDGKPATTAELYFPNGVTLHDTCDDLYIPDWANQRVREIIGGGDVGFNITGKTPICAGTADTLVAFGGTIYKWSNGATTSSIIVSPAIATKYTVQVSNICSDIRDTNITIAVTPSPSITLSGKDTICNGNSTTLNATGGGTYSWSNGATSGSITVNPKINTTYSIIVSKNGCSKDTSIKVTIIPLPSITLSGKDTICGGNYTVLNATGGGTYKWSNGATTGSIIVSPNVTSTYSLIVTGNSGCIKDTNVKVTVIPLPSVSLAGKDSICVGGATTIYVSGGGTYAWNNGATTSSITVAPHNTSVYSLTVTTNGCSKDTSVKITVDPLPSVSLSGNNNICVGGSTTLYVSGGGTYLWNNGATTSTITVSPGANETYSVIVSDNGCSKDTAITVKVSTIDASITGPLTICQGDSVTLYSSGGGTYKWSTGSSTSSILVKPASTTTYSVVITNGPCVKDTSVTVTVEICSTSGVGNYHQASSLINVYPNPNNGSFIVSLLNIDKKCSINIYNVLGQQVYQSNINSDNTEINLRSQPQGIYLYRVITEAGNLVGEGKVVVQ